MTDDNDHGIAGEAHGLVYGARAATYGHPRFDFTAIAKVWTGLLQDLLKEGAELDPYRVAILMTGLKLCRLVKSPQHHDSRVDTIGYMLTMERLDEPAESPVGWVGDDELPSREELLKRAAREEDKLYGRETAEHSAQLDLMQEGQELPAEAAWLDAKLETEPERPPAVVVTWEGAEAVAKQLDAIGDREGARLVRQGLLRQTPFGFTGQQVEIATHDHKPNMACTPACGSWHGGA